MYTQIYVYMYIHIYACTYMLYIVTIYFVHTVLFSGAAFLSLPHPLFVVCVCLTLIVSQGFCTCANGSSLFVGGLLAFFSPDPLRFSMCRYTSSISAARPASIRVPHAELFAFCCCCDLAAVAAAVEFVGVHVRGDSVAHFADVCFGVSRGVWQQRAAVSFVVSSTCLFLSSFLSIYTSFTADASRLCNCF